MAGTICLISLIGWFWFRKTGRKGVLLLAAAGLLLLPATYSTAIELPAAYVGEIRLVEGRMSVVLLLDSSSVTFATDPSFKQKDVFERALDRAAEKIDLTLRPEDLVENPGSPSGDLSSLERQIKQATGLDREIVNLRAKQKIPEIPTHEWVVFAFGLLAWMGLIGWRFRGRVPWIGNRHE